jgi:PilZ domain
VQFPVTLKDAQGNEVHVTAVNLSSYGIGVQSLTLASQCEGLLDVSFALPEENVSIQVKARLVWKESSGRAGIKFIVIEPEMMARLQHWANLKMKEEGGELPQ